jgi:SAM-dependent methyltransferase
MTTISKCRSCSSPRLTRLLDLGSTPLANSLLTATNVGAAEDRFPLLLVFCEECSLVQITETVDPERLFSDYVYFSSFSDAMVRHANELVTSLISERRLGPGSLAVEVASNDGYLLQHYVKGGVPVLGIEPAKNIAKVAVERGVATRAEFFGRELAAKLVAEGKRADVIHANNVLAHVADLNGFVAGFQLLVKPGGVVVIESPYVRDMVEHLEFDTIYHEHLCYYSMTALEKLFRRHGLVASDVQRLSIHGGTLRLFFTPGDGPVGPRVAALLAEEEQLGMPRAAYYSEFSARVERLKVDLLKQLKTLKDAGKRLAAYGASAKGSTLLNYCGIGKDTLDFVVDRSTHKQGRFMPGVHLPISEPARLLKDAPDCVLLLTWNFADEILAQQAEFRSKGGKFLVPVPSPRVV